MYPKLLSPVNTNLYRTLDNWWRGGGGAWNMFTPSMLPPPNISPHLKLYFMVQTSHFIYHNTLFVLHITPYLTHITHFRVQISYLTDHTSLFIFHSLRFSIQSSYYKRHSLDIAFHSFTIHLIANTSYFTLQNSYVKLFSLHSLKCLFHNP